jgi:hypothetical protein
MTVNSYALKKLRQLRREYEPGTQQYQELTRLIELEKFRLKYGTAAYLQLVYKNQSSEYEDLVERTGIDI